MTTHTLIATAALCLATALLPSQAAAAPAKTAGTKAAAAKPAGKPKAKPAARPAKASAHPKLTLPVAAVILSDSQLAMAALVLTGRADCEFNQSVSVEPDTTQPGSFRIKFNSTVYTMVPEDTTTGAVRLVDAKAGVVWLQIPHKSMMMNTRVGRRMVDACTQPAQRQAKAEADAARLDANAAATLSPTLLQSVRAPGSAAGPASAPAIEGSASAPGTVSPTNASPTNADGAARNEVALPPATPASGAPVGIGSSPGPSAPPLPR